MIVYPGLRKKRRRHTRVLPKVLSPCNYTMETCCNVENSWICTLIQLMGLGFFFSMVLHLYDREQCP